MNKFDISQYVERAINNDQAAIEALYHYTYAAAYAFTYHLCQNYDDVEDILQESYLSAFTNLHKIKNKARFWGWLKGVILNKWRDYCRELSDSYDVDVYESALGDSFLYWQLEASVQSLVEDRETSRRVREIVEALPEKQRVCAIRYYYDNLSMDEIANELNIPVGSVKSRLHYARKKIQKSLREQNLFAFSGAAASSGTAGAGMLSQILGALPQGTAAAASGTGLTFRLGAWLLSAVIIVGMAGTAAVNLGGNSSEAVPTAAATAASAAVTTASSAAAVTTATLATTAAETATTAATASSTAPVTTTSATAEPKHVSFLYQPAGGGICITRYTGNESDVVIPSEWEGWRVTAVGDEAFADGRELRSVVLPDTVTVIGEGAFRHCDSLCSVSFGGVSEIGDMAFAECHALQTVDLPPNVKTVGIYAFAYCSSLRSVTVSQGTQTIRYNAFYGCPQLSSVTLPPSVLSIGADAFADGSPELVLHVAENSYSHQYALESAIPYSFASFSYS